MLWYYIVIGIAVLAAFAVGYILGEFNGIKQTEQRWSDCVERTKMMTGHGYINGPQTFEGP